MDNATATSVYIYKQLVKHPNDMLGMLAFAHYQKWVVKFLDDVSSSVSIGQAAAEINLADINRIALAHLDSFTDSARHMLRERDSLILEEVRINHDILQNSLNSIQQQQARFLPDAHQKIAELHKIHAGAFWKYVALAFAIVVISLAIVFIARVFL